MVKRCKDRGSSDRAKEKFLKAVSDTLDYRLNEHRSSEVLFANEKSLQYKSLISALEPSMSIMAEITTDK